MIHNPLNLFCGILTGMGWLYLVIKGGSEGSLLLTAVLTALNLTLAFV